MTAQQYNVLGTRPIRHDGVDKVTGRAQYGADVQVPGLSYGMILRSPHAHAQIKSIVGVSKSTLSHWLRDYPLSQRRMRELRDLNPKRIKSYRETRKRRRED